MYKVSYSSDGTHIFIEDVTDVTGVPITTSIMMIDTQTEEFQAFMKKALRYKDLRNMIESDSRITQIKAVREMHGLTLREAKDLVDSIATGVEKRHCYKDAKSTYEYDAGNK